MRTIIRNNYDPHIGDYHERIIQDEAREKTWLFDCDGVYLDITAGRGDVKVVNELGDSETDATSQKLVTDELAKKQDTLTAGDNITIEGNVISAAGKNYSAGYGLTLTGTEFAANTSVLATQTDLAGKQDTLTTGQLAAVNSGIDSTKVAQIATNASDIDTIEGKIPSAATAQNQLADKSYVDAADNGLQSQIDAISASSDVKDIVGTKAELNSYDTSTLGNNDIIKVLQDESENDATTYYRWSTSTNTFTLIGEEGPYYTKSQANALLNNKVDKVAGKGLSENDFTNADKAKLDGISPGAEANVQSNYTENDASSDAYIQNRPFYDEKVVSEISQASTTTSGSTPDTGYVWFIEQLMDYSLTSELSGFEDGDTVYAKITYSVDGVEKSDTGKFTLSIENDLASLVYDAPAGTRWAGAYISEVNAGDTTVRWPVPSSDASATVYITEIEYTKVKQLDAQYIPVDGDTVRVNADGELEADVQGGPTVVQTTGSSTTDVMSQKAVTDALPEGIKTLTTADYNYPTTGTKTRVRVQLLPTGVYNTGDASCYSYNERIDAHTLVFVSANGNDITVLYVQDRIMRAVVGSTTTTSISPSRIQVRNNLTGDSSWGDAALSAYQGKVLKDLIDSLVIKNAGAPTTSTVGTVGMLLEDTTNGKLYQLTAIDNTDPQNPSYTWSEVGGGSGPTVVQTTGTSTTDVMSQNAVTEMVFADPGTKQRVQIGNSASAGSGSSTSIGPIASASGWSSMVVSSGPNLSRATSFAGIALGPNTEASGVGAIAIGEGARASNRGEVNIGASGSTASGADATGYNSSNYRLLTGLYDPQSDHDAATKGYVDTLIASLEARIAALEGN